MIMKNNQLNKAITQTMTQPWRIAIIWSAAILFYVYEFFLQVSPNVMAPELMKDFQVDAQTLGVLAASFFLAYCAMQLPSGILMDRYGPRRVLVLASSVCALGAYLFGTAQSLAMAEMGRIFIGLGGAFAALGCLKLTTSWFSASYFPLMSGLVLSFGMVGAISGQAPLAYLVEQWGWRSTLVYGSYLGLFLSIFIFLIVRDEPSSQHKQKVHSAKEPFFAGLIQIVKQKHNWLLALYAGLIFSPIAGFCGLWGVPFLSETYQITRTSASGLISWVFIGVALGSPLLGCLANQLGRRKPTMWLGTATALVLLMWLVYFPHTLSYTGLTLLLFTFGVGLSGFFGSFAIMRETNHPRYSATALSFINMLNMIGGALAQPLIGRVLDNRWAGQLLDGARVFSTVDYQFALSVLIGFLFMSLILLRWVRETYCHSLNVYPMHSTYGHREMATYTQVKA